MSSLKAVVASENATRGAAGVAVIALFGSMLGPDAPKAATKCKLRRAGRDLGGRSWTAPAYRCGDISPIQGPATYCLSRRAAHCAWKQFPPVVRVRFRWVPKLGKPAAQNDILENFARSRSHVTEFVTSVTLRPETTLRASGH